MIKYLYSTIKRNFFLNFKFLMNIIMELYHIVYRSVILCKKSMLIFNINTTGSTCMLFSCVLTVTMVQPKDISLCYLYKPDQPQHPYSACCQFQIVTLMSPKLIVDKVNKCLTYNTIEELTKLKSTILSDNSE